jgi:hypothetical protein
MNSLDNHLNGGQRQESARLKNLSPQVRSDDRALKIACVHTERNLAGEVVGAMNVIRYLRMSEALARRGHEVHLVVGGHAGLPANHGVREVPASQVRWHDYDVVKTFFHGGFAALSAWGGDDHPFIVSNLGSVVGSTDTEGVYFYGSVRDHLWKVQQRIAKKSRIVSLLTKQNADLWRRMHGDTDVLVEVPCGVDSDVPTPSTNPYAALGIAAPVALFAGNIYNRDRQAEVNLFWQERLNRLGRALQQCGVRLVAMGPGQTDRLDPNVVTHAGIIDFREFWNWQWHASVGVVLAQGAIQDNESSKIYYYLRTGLPVACESSVPNAWLVSHTGHGTIVEYDGDDVTDLAEATAALAGRPPNKNGVIPYMIAEHSWDARAAVYAPLLAAAPSRQSASRS